jgi:hypothetical protein
VVTAKKAGCGQQATKRATALLMRAFFMVWSATNARGDLSQIADPDTLSKTAKKEKSNGKTQLLRR